MDAIERKTIPDQLVANIISAIEKGELRAGDRLPTERELAERFGIARTSVREALKRLENMGILAMKPGAGTFVMPITLAGIFDQSLLIARLAELHRSELSHILACRRAIERQTAHEAATQCTEAQIADLRNLVDRSELLRTDPEAFIENDLAFHVKIAEATKNSVYPLIVRLLRALYLHSDRAVKLATKPGLMDRSIEHHRAILRALESRDPQRATAAMEEHLRYNEEIVLEMETDRDGAAFENDSGT